MKTRAIISILVLSSLLLIGLLSKNITSNLQKSETKYEKLIFEKQKNIVQVNQDIPGFYVRGSFSAIEQFKYEGYEIIIFIETVKNVMRDVDNPDYINPKAYIRLVDSKMKYIDCECPNPSINKEKVEFRSVETPVGIIEFHGGFVDKEGQPWNKSYTENYKTILKGTLRIEKDGKVYYSQLHDFEYWDGADW